METSRVSTGQSFFFFLNSDEIFSGKAQRRMGCYHLFMETCILLSLSIFHQRKDDEQGMSFNNYHFSTFTY